MKQRLLYIFSALLVATTLQARTVRLYGYITDTDNHGIEFANVYVQGTEGIIEGTTTNKNGYYDLMMEQQDSVTLVISMVGYVTTQMPITNAKEVLNINAQMPTDEQWLEEVEVRGIKHTQGTMDRIDAATTRVMPDATGGSIESILITFAGVNQNNELSSQYNVRGGSFDENEVYVNGIEVHRPLLIRSGQQEGLSFVNPEMAQNVQFSAGGFSSQYGDKMSSVLDITYKRPDRFESSISASLLGASVYVGHGDSAYSQMHGIRYKTSSYLLGAMPTTGNYSPNFFDYQTYVTWNIDRCADRSRKSKVERPWTMAFLGNVSLNDYGFKPDSLSENFGGLDTKNMSVWYEGQEKDRFLTAFAALSAQGHVSKEVNIGFDLSGFYTNERENFDITAEYVLSSGNSSVSATGQQTGQVENDTPTEVLATGIFHQHARNRLEAGVVTLSHHGEWKHENNNLIWGISGQLEMINDHISEWEWRDSAGYSQPNNEHAMELYYSMRGNSDMLSGRLQAYIENSHRWETDKCKILFTIGGRLNWWSFTNEVLASPRASVEFIPGWKRDFSFRLATGLYYQAPFYKELRDTVTDAQGVTRIQLNNKIKAQRSVHVVAGLDYYFRGWGRPFKLTAEAYYKYIDRMISYTVDNVRVRYSGENDAHGYAVGADIKLYGELVPGADSWISFGLMSAKQQLDNHPEWGWMPSPQEQRYSFSMLFQDYIPKVPQLLFHIKFIWNDGLPYSAPHNAWYKYRMPTYRRIDIGATYVFNQKTAKFMRAPSAKHVKEWALQLEVFNIVDWHNVNSYFWVTDANNQLWRSPNYLTGRMFNFKVRVDLK